MSIRKALDEINIARKERYEKLWKSANPNVTEAQRKANFETRTKLIEKLEKMDHKEIEQFWKDRKKCYAVATLIDDKNKRIKATKECSDE